MRYLLLLAVVIVLLGAGVVTNFLTEIQRPLRDFVPAVLFTVEKGQGVGEIAESLRAAGIPVRTLYFKAYAYLDGSASSFIAGTYEIPPDASTKDVVDTLTSGRVSNERAITVIEGWTSKDIADYLANKGVLTKQEFLLASQTADTRKIIPEKDYPFLADKPTTAGLEGFLFPDTYRIYKDSRADQIVERMLDNFGAKFTQELRDQAAEQGLTVYQAVTLASIVEKEVRTAEDRKIAAGIFLTRLRNGIGLQSDATVNYVTGKKTVQASAEDLETDSLYNTYKYRGLPPGPISNPSLASLEAVAEPTETDYLYFLTKPDGTTVFSKTYEEHLANKAKYLQ